MCESSNAALREARRKKILENSAHRLKLIESINSSNNKNTCDTFQEPKPEPEVRKTSTRFRETSNSELNSKLCDLIKNSKELKDISDFLLKENDKRFEDEAEVEEENDEDEEVDINTVEPKRGNVFLRNFLQKRLHYVLLALVVNFLFFFNAGYLFYENIFCPFYSLKIIDLLSKTGEKNVHPVLSLAVAGLPTKLQKVTKHIFSLLQFLLSDLFIYLFTFIIGAKIINKAP